ncbi:hypothetical protein [Gephyromycinifex aptenodytis]|uniref:hypothetical protein n=1 Tax=Gephyromycinifex aptenodytis TaxID=2716227 RepID=UPI001448269E|nr:hypothetical protein [Gephyromycinifex aptenodytis]
MTTLPAGGRRTTHLAARTFAAARRSGRREDVLAKGTTGSASTPVLTEVICLRV